jgi:hypothetical protein
VERREVRPDLAPHAVLFLGVRRVRHRARAVVERDARDRVAPRAIGLVAKPG